MISSSKMKATYNITTIFLFVPMVVISDAYPSDIDDNNAAIGYHPNLELDDVITSAFSGLEPNTNKFEYLDSSQLDFKCARLNDQKQKKQFPDWVYAAGGNEIAPTSEKQDLSKTWEPILEPVTACNGLSKDFTKTFTFLVVLDKSWVEYYEKHSAHFTKQGYNTLKDSPYLLIDRVNYLFEAQFGVNFAIPRVVSFSDLKNACKTNNGHSDDGTQATSTNWHLKNAGISSLDSDAGIMRLGTGLPDVYCHSTSPLTDGCSPGSILTVQSKPFHEGRFNHRSAVTLAHELGHFFGICPDDIPDIMVWNGTPAKNARPEGMFFKFLTVCADVYRDVMCQNFKDAPQTCGVKTIKNKYHKVSSGTCASNGYSEIFDKVECKHVAKKFGFKITWGPHGGYPDVVNGCSVRSDYQLFLNPKDKCNPNSHVDHWTYTKCKCTDWMPCLCKNKSGKTNGNDCKDKNKYCSNWSGQGFCKGRYQVYMTANCAKSCNVDCR